MTKPFWTFIKSVLTKCIDGCRSVRRRPFCFYLPLWSHSYICHTIIKAKAHLDRHWYDPFPRDIWETCWFMSFLSSTAREVDMSSLHNNTWWWSVSNHRLIFVWSPIRSDRHHFDGSGSVVCSVADPWHFGVDPDPDPRIHASDWWIRILDLDPAIFVIELQDANKKLIF